ncbi:MULTISPECIES: NYN domain-containing protein [Anaerotruncus]|uniref:NYN domain-containing protein n=2 Tax=Anaerotruncus TaxID=244127 RepID=A0A498CPB3_9FIRM|nr:MULTISPECIES: NYN domain-containing protein [Anaerotruncus]MBC3938182.1 NYN domain-containing protein [Anaerotruncus massiliensis (ex Togo et al. 2019)]RLL13216.1 NYN domain-containing protein [Anaerotruncus massiliensis (ex Liu et al. 2021)]
MASDSKFAVLIDADNISGKYIKIILDEISNDGIATYKRIYGDWTSPALVSWKNVLLDNSILPIQQYSYTTGKNSTDSAMIIDAMDILYSGQVDGFCIVSSDSDFTRLAARLRESGMTVVGMGERKTPKSFISACNRFKYLDILATAEQKEPEKPAQPEKPKQQPKQEKARPAPKQEPKPEPRPEPEPAPEPCPEPEEKQMTGLRTIKKAIRTIVAENSDEDGWLFIGTIGNLLVKRYPDFDVRNFGFSKLTPFIESLDLFDIKSVRTRDSSVKLIYVKLK